MDPVSITLSGVSEAPRYDGHLSQQQAGGDTLQTGLPLIPPSTDRRLTSELTHPECVHTYVSLKTKSEEDGLYRSGISDMRVDDLSTPSGDLNTRQAGDIGEHLSEVQHQPLCPGIRHLDQCDRPSPADDSTALEKTVDLQTNVERTESGKGDGTKPPVAGHLTKITDPEDDEIRPSPDDAVPDSKGGSAIDSQRSLDVCQIEKNNASDDTVERHAELNTVRSDIKDKDDGTSATGSTSNDTKDNKQVETQDGNQPRDVTSGQCKDRDELDVNENDDEVMFNFSSEESDSVDTSDDGAQLELSSDSVVFPDDGHCVDVMVKLETMREYDQFCDVTIRVQDHCYRAHRCVLAASGATLQTMIGHQGSDVIDLSETISSSEAFQTILKYIYTGHLSISMASVSDILASGKKLGIASVLKFCFMYVENKINMNTWAHVLQLSLNYDFPDVTQKVVRFFASHLRHLYRKKEAMFFSEKQLEHILKHSNCSSAPDVEPYKLKLLLYWVIDKYEDRSAILPKFLQYINADLLTRESMEQVLREKKIKKHEVFEEQAIKSFIAAVKERLTAKKRVQKQKANRECSQPIRTSKRGRPRKVVNYKQVDDSSTDVLAPDEDEFCSDEPVVMLKRRRGRPPKAKTLCLSSATVIKRPRGRPKKHVPGDQMCDGQVIKQEDNTEQMSFDINKSPSSLTTDVDVKPEFTAMSEADMKLLASSATVKTWSRSFGSDGHVCLTCGKKFALRKQLTRHVVIHREKTKMCDLCDYKTTRNDKVRDHIRRVHPDEAVARGLLSPEEHRRRLLMEANKPCLFRPRKSRVKKLLDKPDDMVSCPKCSRKFTSISTLRHHMKGHGSDTPFLCEICGFTTKHFASINVHKRQHNGKKFHCTFPGCDYENIRKSRLDDHISAHSGIKNHVCAVCGKAFAGRKHMQRHEKTHLEVKPLKCEQCEYATTRRDKLRDHIRKHHKAMAISLGILDPNKVDEINELKPARIRKLKKKKTKEQEESTPVASDTVGQLIGKGDTEPPVGIPRQETDQVANFVAMTVPPHFLGVTTSTISEEVIQCLASMMPNSNLGGSHSQIHPSLTLPVAPPQSIENVQTIQGIQVTQPSAVTLQAIQPQQQVMRAQHSEQVSTERGDTWIYHIIPDDENQYT